MIRIRDRHEDYTVVKDYIIDVDSELNEHKAVLEKVKSKVSYQSVDSACYGTIFILCRCVIIVCNKENYRGTDELFGEPE